jgi:hypothetical protein
MAYGAYGSCTQGGGAYADLIQSYLGHHGLHSQFYDQATPSIIQTAINRGDI